MKLVHALVLKSLAETILVTTLAVAFYFSAFPPYFHGWGEAAPHAISGWVINQRVPWQRVEVQLFIDGRFVATAVANRPRPDVVNSGWGSDEWHGYEFPAPAVPLGFHEARVYALHSSSEGIRTLQQVGDPIQFTVDESGTLHNRLKASTRKGTDLASGTQ